MNKVNFSVVLVGLMLILAIGPAALAADRPYYTLDRPSRTVWKTEGGQRVRALSLTPPIETDHPLFWEALAKLVWLANLPPDERTRRAYIERIVSRTDSRAARAFLVRQLVTFRIEAIQTVRQARDGGLDLFVRMNRPAAPPLLFQYRLEERRDGSSANCFANYPGCGDE